MYIDWKTIVFLPPSAVASQNYELAIFRPIVLFNILRQVKCSTEKLKQVIVVEHIVKQWRNIWLEFIR